MGSGEDWIGSSPIVNIFPSLASATFVLQAGLVLLGSNIATAPPNRAGRNAPPSLARPVNEPARRAYPNLQVIDETGLIVAPFPQAALFLAGKALTPYSRAGGSAGCLTDFFVGAHAAVH
ncbi:hypothetical protein [Rhizobium leguminosarum]|uniref:hypothetical protein n=1 Tax=Rhizobium leguminosarum TaxID=384 RepID=UPI001FE12201|nr:hypothetical protein [Rhizobium leguminosarum]